MFKQKEITVLPLELPALAWSPLGIKYSLSDTWIGLLLGFHPYFPDTRPEYWGQVDCKTVGFFFSKSIKKSVKRGVRVLRARSARASHSRRACEAWEKKPTVRFPYNKFFPTSGFKTFVEQSKICSQLRPLCEFDTLGHWFRERIARVIVCSWLRILTLYPVILKQFLA